MPRAGKKKKKGRNRKNKDHGRQSNSNDKPSAQQGSTNQISFESVPPNFQPFPQRGKVLPDNYRTEYSLYKAATKRVFEYLKEYTQEKQTRQDDESMIMNVKSLVTAADRMAEESIPVDPDILKDLKFAIRIRSRVARSVYGGGDSGHKYLLDTLIYCWKVLDSLPRAEQDKEEEAPDSYHAEGRSSNRFKALQENGEVEEGEADEEIFTSQDVPRPSLDSDSMPLQDLSQSEELMDAWLFLGSLNELMRVVAGQYAQVAQCAHSIPVIGCCASALVPCLMRATIGANMAIQQVQRLEIEFELQNPHINTPYRLLSTIRFPKFVELVVQISREHEKHICSARDANLFLGDCLECTFRVGVVSKNKSEEILSDFCSRFEIDSEGSEKIDHIFSYLQSSTLVEVPLKPEFEINEDHFHEGRFDEASHVWLPPGIFEYIGGDRAILHTIKLLQLFGSFTGKPMLETPPKGYFGSPWEPGRSNKIHNDLDGLLMDDILPYWFLICQEWMSANEICGPYDTLDQLYLPRQSELAPLWGCFRRFFRSPEKPVKWSIAFAIHAMLTAILETDKITTGLASVCQEAFDLYFHQLDISCEYKQQLDDSSESSLFELCITTIRCCKYLFGHASFGPRTLWNPLCGGTFLLYVNYRGNIDLGTGLINDRSQLTIVLHLYHALVVNDILKPEDTPFLAGLYGGFEKSKTLWGGSSSPRKGKFVEQFWTSMKGRLRVCAETLAKSSRIDDAILSNQYHLGIIDLLCRSERREVRGNMHPEEFSTSFRRICNRDYHDVVDWCYSKKIRQKHGEEDGYTFAVQLNDTMRAFIKENTLFSYNLLACGIHLDEFVCGMSRFFQWDQLFNGALGNQTAQHPERIAQAYMFANYVLGALDQAKDPSELGRIKDFVTSIMCPFFEKLSNDKVRWFQGIADEISESETNTSSN